MRVEDETWAQFERFCEQEGISASAFLQASIEGWMSFRRRYEERPVREWGMERAVDVIADARRIDAQRRRRHDGED